ncbi:MAG: DUF1285 domain-containing protein [Alphaproteobacteria bacterium]|nr:DUF1285 domain-containing protein [Alphaproteobacteria bacterium]
MSQTRPASPTDLFRGIEQQIWSRAKRGPAPVEKWEPDFCGDIDMRIARDGTWFYMGSPIGRIAMVQMFASVLRRDPDSKYYLVTPVEKIGIKVDDAPFVAIEMKVANRRREQVLSFRTNADDWVSVDADHPLRMTLKPRTLEPSPYVLVRGRLEALINRAIFYDLVELCVDEAVDGQNMFGVWSSNLFYPFMPSDQVGRTLCEI